MGCHDPLSLHHQQAVGTAAVTPPTQLLVPLETRNDPMIPAASTLRGPEQPTRRGRCCLLGGGGRGGLGWPRGGTAAIEGRHLSLTLAAHPAKITRQVRDDAELRESRRGSSECH